MGVNVADSEVSWVLRVLEFQLRTCTRHLRSGIVSLSFAGSLVVTLEVDARKPAPTTEK